MKPVASCRHVWRVYGRGATAVVAVKDASFDIAVGSSLALKGPSGSGKSTLLHLLAGIDEPTDGEMSWPELGGHPAGLRPGTVGVVFQGPSLLPALDVVENVALPLVLAGSNDADAQTRAAALLGELGLGALAAMLPEELSGGQAQRVAVARALVAEPFLILADEPTGQLDHVAGAAVIGLLLEEAARLGAALIVTTHDPAVADRFPRQWQMVDGQPQGEELSACSR